MNSFKKSLAALALAAMVAGGFGAATLAANPAHAQSTSETAPAAPEAGWHHHHPGKHGIGAMRLLEGRIAFIKAMLKITPAQEADFKKFADAMRANVQERVATSKDMRETHVKGPMTAIDRLAMVTQFSQMRAQGDARLLAAFKPLYAALTPDQQNVANRLAAMMMHHGMRHGGHHGRW